MNETMNYIFRKLDHLERENRRRAASTFCVAVVAATATSWAFYFKNRKINNLKSKVKDLEAKIEEIEKE